MGDLDGSAGSSTGVYRGSGGVYLAKDNATGECTNILNLMSRKFSSWAETHDECRKLCGIVDVKPIMVSEKLQEPAQDRLGAIRGTDTFRYLNSVRGLSESTLMKYEVRTHKRNSRHNENFWAAKFYDPSGDLVMIKSTGINKTDKDKKIFGPPLLTLRFGTGTFVTPTQRALRFAKERLTPCLSINWVRRFLVCLFLAVALT